MQLVGCNWHPEAWGVLNLRARLAEAWVPQRPYGAFLKALSHVTIANCFTRPRESLFSRVAGAFECCKMRIEQGQYKVKFAKLLSALCGDAGFGAATEG
jgi:hypothetical protein